jgi:hypothetical protein
MAMIDLDGFDLMDLIDLITSQPGWLEIMCHGAAEPRSVCFDVTTYVVIDFRIDWLLLYPMDVATHHFHDLISTRQSEVMFFET